MTDDRFDRELRGFLASRAPASLSPVLRARLQAVTAESPARAGAFAGRLGGAWRAAVGVVAVGAAAVVLLAVLTRVDGLTIRDPGQVGGPSAVPGVPAIPFVTAPAEVFTPGAVAEAQRQLAAVFAATGVEARFVVTPVDSGTQLAAPAGWPGAFDSDGDPDRDILAVIGVTPDGTPVCCLTLAGDLVERARADGYWRPTDQPGALDADLAASTAEFRDVALDRFVRGIEDLAPGLASLGAETLPNSEIQRIAGLLAFVGPLLLLAIVGLRRRPGSTGASALDPADSGVELLEVTPGAETGPGSSAVTTASALAASAGSGLPVTSPVATSPVVPWQGVDQQTVSASRWPAMPPWAVRSDRTWVLVSFVAMAGLALVGVVDMLLPANAAVRLDPAVDGIGVTRPDASVLSWVLVGIAVTGLVMYAWQGRWRRRIGVVALVALVGWTTSVVVDQTIPTRPGTDRGWVADDGGEVIWRDGYGLTEQVSYDLAPGDALTIAMTIENPGALPLTILGLDGVRASQPNPHLVSIVGIGWVVQPRDDGAITVLSARPEDASASWPVTLGPGEDLAIVILGRGGPCTDADGTATLVPLTHFGLAYRVLGFERTTEIGMPVMLTVAQRNPCTVEVPGGTITYSTPDQ